MNRLTLTAYGISDVGIKKETNEDSFVYKVADVSGLCAGLFAVADGVGGLSHGDLASQTCIKCLNQWWMGELNRYSVGNASIGIDSLRKSIIETNSRILSLSGEEDFRSGTTLTVLVVLNRSAVIAHVGDSRCYRLRRNFLWHFNRLTTDHSCEKTKFVDGVAIKKAMLTDCLGYRRDFRLDIMEFEISDGDLYMLCSDGIYKTQCDDSIEAILRRSRRSVHSICEELVSVSKSNLETDNISVIAVSVGTGAGRNNE